MKLQRSDVAVQWILWPDRWRKSLVEVNDEMSSGGGLHRYFADHLGEIYTKYSREDFDFAIDDVIKPKQNLADWYCKVLDCSGITIEFYNGAPHIPQDKFALWRMAITRIDADALITLAFVRSFHRVPRPNDLINWGVYPISSDYDLKGLFTKGLTDIHAHLEGCYPVPHLWLSLVEGGRQISHFPEYRRLYRDGFIAPRSILPLAEEWLVIYRALDIRRSFSPTRLDDTEDARGFPSPVSSAMWAERSMLAHQWDRILKREAKREETARFDRYLVAKNLFLARHIQTPWGNRGLQQFRTYFDRARLSPWPETPRVQWLRQRPMVHFVSESKYLKYIEFRISPLGTVADYARYFTNWDRYVRSDKFLSKGRMTFRFVVHFIRESLQTRDDEVPFARLRQRLDRETAVLHLFRCKYPHLACHIVGVDVANYERTCPPDVFTPYLRLFRKHDNKIVRSEYLKHWNELQQRNLHHIPPSFPPLGFTFHAGEDYFHPMDGIRTMHGAMKGLDMRSGDRIGHGLAAGRSIKHFHQDFGESLHLPRGVALDNLVWLFHELSHRIGESVVDMRRIAEEIEHLSEDCYGKAVTPAMMIRVQELRHEILLDEPPKKQPLDESHAIRNKEWFDPTVKKKRKEVIRNPDVFKNAEKEIELAQESLMKELARRGVVIEFNPSSNFVTGGIESLTFHPFFRYHNALHGKLRATINCDDPGTFATRIENEFSCMLNALMLRDIGKDDALELLDAMRQAGADFRFVNHLAP
ncbi:MAG: hypothetical protein HQL74_15200 [Magnetococcales bacterium]|nr:hypothetical protein [Magnetococcales bacterium]